MAKFDLLTESLQPSSDWMFPNMKRKLGHVPLVHGSFPELQGAYHVPLFVHIRGPEQFQRVDAFFPAEQMRHAYEVLDDMRVTWKTRKKFRSALVVPSVV